MEGLRWGGILVLFCSCSLGVLSVILIEDVEYGEVGEGGLKKREREREEG